MRPVKIRSYPVKPAGTLAPFKRLGLILLPLLLCGSVLGCGSSTTPVTVTGVSLDHPTLSLTAGGAAATLTATVSPANATNQTVIWSTSNASVATVSNGVVTPVGAGSATITVTTLDGAKTATCAVTVTAPVVSVTGVSLDQSILNLTAGGATATLTATVSPANATDQSVTWSTSNASVATVSNGVVTPVGVGSATITVTTVDGARTATCRVTVAAPVVRVTGVSLDQSALNLAAGVATATLTATLSPANATNNNVSWSTSDPTVAAVSSGVVTPVGAGSATITVTTVDGAKTATCAVTVAAAPGPQLIAIGSLDGDTDLSGLTGTLENGDPASVLGGLGSGMAWAGGNTFLNVPDRGPNAVAYNSGASVDNTTAYIGRFHSIQMELTPNPGPGLPYLLTPTLTNTTLLSSTDPLSYGTGSSQALTDVLNLNIANGVSYFTGRSDGYGSGDSGNPLASRLDPEAIRVANDGQSVFVSDEYGPDVYQFDRTTGRRIRSFTLPSGFYVANESPVGATEISGNTSGRVSNKGMEGLAITPDGSTLVGVMQSALIQDGGNKAKVNRVITIDIASGATHQYAYNNLIGGASYNSSEIVALNSHEFLVDERDGNGLGAGNGATIKQLYKIDLSGATDVSAISGEANLLPYAVDKTLFLDIRAVLNSAGIADADIPAKIEGVAIGSDVVITGITKHTLWVANDNDFVPAAAGTNQFFVFAVSDADLGGSVFVPQAVTPSPAP